MNASSLTLQRPSGGAALRAILAGGFIAGTIDIGAASLINGINPLTILRFVAGGLLGAAALQGGMGASVLGLILQWAMSLLIAAIFVLAALRLRWLTAQPIIAGLAYGVVIYFVMNYVVLPLSAWHHVPAFKLVSFLENLAAMLVFGLIIAFCARRSLRP
ncbi:MAG TPA: hypothetical protein VJ727_11865 [Rhodanobacteraceae bacterium]|nr:hypothetical protein [Rhodanobacteraceae bacterium]